MEPIFWDRKRVFMVEFIKQGTTITPEVRCESLKQLRGTVLNKSHGMLISGVMLFHDNACLLTAPRTTALL
jgi:hypothetical protein